MIDMIPSVVHGGFSSSTRASIMSSMSSMSPGFARCAIAEEFAAEFGGTLMG